MILDLLLENYGSAEIIQAIKTVRAHQGLPADQVENQVLLDAINTGLLPTPSVESMRGRKAFLFTPGQPFRTYEKSILDQSREDQIAWR